MLPLPKLLPPLLALAALSAPALRTVRLHVSGEIVVTYRGGYCPLSATPYEPLDVEWLWEITRLTITAEAAGLPTAVMALGLVAVLAFRGAWSARVTAALFVAIAVVFTIPYAITTVPDDCGSSLRFGGWHIVEPGPAVHYLAAAALVGSLGRIRSRRGTGAERMIG